MELFSYQNLKKEALIDRFKKLTESYCSLMGRYGSNLGAWNERCIQALQEKTESELIEINKKLERTLNYYIRAEEEKINPNQEKQILWSVIKDKGWSFGSDLFSSLKDSDVIEIYLPNFTHYFGNSNFCKICSYDVGELATYPWNFLFERPAEVTQKLIEIANRVFSGETRETVHLNIRPHIGKEVFSQKKFRISINMGIISPLFDKSNQVAGIVATFSAKPTHLTG